MPVAEACVATSRASRYLRQLCRHADGMRVVRQQFSAGDGTSSTRPEVNHVEHSDAVAAIQFSDGRLTMQATGDTLTLRVEAADDAALRRLQDGVAARLQTIGRRDQLTTTWHRLETPPAPPGDINQDAGLPADVGSPKRRWPRRLTVLALVAGIAVIVAVHLGIGGAAVAALPWTGWLGGSLLVIVLAKLVFIASHAILGRFAFRRGKSIHARWKVRRSPAMSKPAPPAREECARQEDDG